MTLPVPDLRVEQGRVGKGGLVDVTNEEKYQLTEKVEALFGTPTATPASRAPSAAGGVPSRRFQKRVYRPGTI